MKQKDKNSSPIVRKDIVKDIFSKSKPEKEKVSTIFTHFRHSPKIILPSPEKDTMSPLLKPLPAAIDIGASTIKLLQLAEGEKGKMEIICIDEENLSTGATGADYGSAASIGSALQRIISRNRIGHLCITTLSAKYTQLYNMSFPPMPESELIPAIRYKVTQLKPFDLEPEKLIIRFLRWDTPQDLSKTSPQRLIVACVRRDAVEERAALLREFGLTPVKIGLSPFDLVNLSKFYKGGELKDEVNLWIDFGAENTSLAIEKNGLLCFSRNLSLASRQMTKAFAKYRGIGETDAENLKRDCGLTFWSPDKKIPLFYEPPKLPSATEEKSEMVYYGLISHLENLVVDIMHSFKYFSYQVAHSQITRFDRLIMCGGGANLKNLDQFLSVRLGVPVERINPFSLFRLSYVMQDRRRDLLRVASDFAVCTGLAIGQRMEQPKQIDLLSEKEKKHIKIFAEAIKRKQVIAAAAAVIVAFSLVVIQMARAGYYKREMDYLTKEARDTKAKLGNMQAKQLDLNKEEAELLNKKALLEARLNLIKKGLREPKDFSERLASIADLLPEEVWVTKLSYKDGRLVITGCTTNIALIATLIEDIKSSEKFVDADFNYTEKDPATQVYNFEVIADIRA